MGVPPGLARLARPRSFDASFAVAEKRPIAEHTVARLCLTTGRIVRQFGANEHVHAARPDPGAERRRAVTDVGAHVVIGTTPAGGASRRLAENTRNT